MSNGWPQNGLLPLAHHNRVVTKTFRKSEIHGPKHSVICAGSCRITEIQITSCPLKKELSALPIPMICAGRPKRRNLGHDHTKSPPQSSSPRPARPVRSTRSCSRFSIFSQKECPDFCPDFEHAQRINISSLGTEKGVITKGVFSLEESLESL